MPGPRIEIEDDPTPLVMAMSRELERRLEDPEFAALTDGLCGTGALRVEGGPEAASFELGEAIAMRHGAAVADATATLDNRARWDHGPIDGEDEHPEVAAWLRALASPAERTWQDAAARFWAALEAAPGAPTALLVANLDTGESERFGDGERAYEIRGETEGLVALLEGRASLLQEAFERRVYIRGSFPEVSTLAGAAARVRFGEPPIDA